jgi:two-component system, OmpR family, sensor histidine kinase KdpD
MRFPRAPTSALQFWKGILLALAAVSITTFVLAPLRVRLTVEVIALLYLLPIILAAARWGLASSLTASLTAFVAYNFFFLTPTYSLTVNDPEELLGLVVFLLVAVLVSQSVAESRLQALRTLDRERDAMTLFELTRALETSSRLEETLEDVAWKMADAFGLETCEILVGSRAGTADIKGSYRIESPGTATKDSRPGGPLAPSAPLELPLFARMLPVGYLRLHPLPGTSLAPSALRLLNAYTGQLALFIERVRLTEEADRARVLEESDRLKSALLSSVSHDLRTPLAAIKASATVLLEEDIALDASTRHDLLSAIDEETDRLNRLVRDLLDMSRIEAGALQLKPDWCDLNDLIRAAVRRYNKPPLTLPVNLRLPADLPLVFADYVQVDRVMSNLLENAIRFAPPDTAIDITAGYDAEQITVTVTNRGPAIPPRLHAHLFDKFYRVSDERPADMGTGLGLSICKGIVEAHRGTIWVESPVDGNAGVRFLFTLPVAPHSLQPLHESLV